MSVDLNLAKLIVENSNIPSFFHKKILQSLERKANPTDCTILKIQESIYKEYKYVFVEYSNSTTDVFIVLPRQFQIVPEATLLLIDSDIISVRVGTGKFDDYYKLIIPTEFRTAYEELQSNLLMKICNFIDPWLAYTNEEIETKVKLIIDELIGRSLSFLSF